MGLFMTSAADQAMVDAVLRNVVHLWIGLAMPGHRHRGLDE